MKNFLLNLILTIGLVAPLAAQNHAQFSGYMYNKLHFNPAYAGNNEQMDFSVFYRDQWSEIEGSPRSINANGHTTIADDRVGIGLSIINDQLGPVNQNAAIMSYAYRFKPDKKNVFAFGVSGRLEHYQVAFSNLQRTDIDDPNAPIVNTTHFKPNFGIGFMWYGETHYVGVSIPRILNGHINQIYSLENNARNYFMNAGKIFALSRRVKVHPSMMMGLVLSAPLKLDLGAQLIFDDKIFVGGNFRFNESVAAIAKYQISDALAIGGAYETTISSLRAYTGNTIEVFAEYSLSRSVHKKVNIRYY